MQSYWDFEVPFSLYNFNDIPIVSLQHFRRVLPDHSSAILQLLRCFSLLGDFAIKLSKRDRSVFLLLSRYVLLSQLQFLLTAISRLWRTSTSSILTYSCCLTGGMADWSSNLHRWDPPPLSLV